MVKFQATHTEVGVGEEGKQAERKEERHTINKRKIKSSEQKSVAAGQGKPHCAIVYGVQRTG